jgi:pimeloyl-ACP methyl ester carboxylesterase
VSERELKSATEESTQYLEVCGESVCTVLHRPPAVAARDTAVLLCPPFGFDEICSYRPRREWARRLAAAGYPTLRVSYPGTGDSGGDPRDPHLLGAWTSSVESSAAWLRAATGATRLVAIGIELGGLLACCATSAGAPIDDLALWATPGRGRALIRQLKAFSALEMSEFFEGLGVPPPLPAGELQAGGFVLSAETTAALEALDLGELQLPDASSRRVLLLGRDGIAADGRLRDRLEDLGAEVRTEKGFGYTAMTSHPQTAEAPHEVMQRVAAWLDEASMPLTGVGSRAEPDRPRQSAQVRHGTSRLQESALTFEQPFGRLSAIVTEPSGERVSGLCVVLLNAGAVHRTGPNRMWVETARRWAARGVRAVRLDMEGIGDADGETTPYRQNGSLYAPKFVTQVRAVLDALTERGLGERFLLVGLCAGAYWAVHLAIDDDRVGAALMLNPRQLLFDPDRAAARDFRAVLTEFSWSQLRKNATRERVRALLRWVVLAPTRVIRRAPSGPHVDTPDKVLDRLCASGKRALFLFADHEPLHAEMLRSGALSRLAGCEDVRVEYVPVRDHTFRPAQSQLQVSQILDRMLDRELGARNGNGAGSDSGAACAPLLGSER